VPGPALRDRLLQVQQQRQRLPAKAGRYKFKNKFRDKYNCKFESDGNRNGRRTGETKELLIAAGGD